MRQSYEIHVLQNGRWSIHAQFSAHQKDAAISDAKDAENMRGVESVKVVQDLYDADKGISHEQVVYKRTLAPKSKDYYARGNVGGNAGGGSGSGSSNPFDDLDDADDDFGLGSDFSSSYSSRKSEKGSIGVFTKLLLVVLISLFIAALFGIVIGETLPRKKIFGVWMVGKTHDNAVFIVAIVAFLVSVVTLSIKFLSGESIDSGRSRKKARPAKQAKARRKKKKTSSKQDGGKKGADKKGKGTLAPSSEEQDEQPEPDHLEDVLVASDSTVNDAEVSTADEFPDLDDESDDLPEDNDEGDDGDEGLNNILSTYAAQQQALVMSLFQDALTSLPPAMQKMDSFNKFGVNLYMAGAAEMISTEKELDPMSAETILRSTVKLMGYKDEHAEAFAARYHEYLLQDARYMTMFQIGRQDMAKKLKGEETPPVLTQALTDWNLPKAVEDTEKEVVVLFTDIVGSTAMTHEKGNKGAQEIVRAHNKIVREALMRTSGHEIKHTGDGIMASFNEIPQGILGASEMQRMIIEHNAQYPELPVRVKIGLAAGQAVVEDNDLFGVTVQMAARIVDKAHEGQVLVSDAMYGMMKGGNTKFVKRGPYLMKGIDGPAYLYEVLWNPNADVAAIEFNAAEEAVKLAQYAEATGGDTANAPKGEEIPELPSAPAQKNAPAQTSAPVPSNVPASPSSQPATPATASHTTAVLPQQQAAPKATGAQQQRETLKSLEALKSKHAQAPGTQVNSKT